MKDRLSVAWLLPIATVLLLGGASVFVDRRLNGIPTLPMQWDLQGHVNWKANRRMALSFTPVLAAVLLGWTAWRGQGLEPLESAVVLLVLAIVFIAVNALYLTLVLRGGRAARAR